METHLIGAAHWKKLGSKFNWQLPPPDVAEDLSHPWVEKIPTPKGPYFFNHVTGQHGLLSDTGGSVAPQQNSHSSSSPAYQSSPAAAPYPQPAAAPGHSPNAMDSQHHAPIASAPAVDRAYEDALMSKEKGAWRRFMEPLATAAADELLRVSGSWDYSCPMCQQDNTRGLADHVPSQNHWKALGGKLNWRPPPLAEDAHAMDKPWVQRIPTSQGVFLFNHSTGRHGLEGQLAGHATPSSITPTIAEPSATPSGAGSPTEGKFNHAHWLWVNTARLAAEQVDEITSHRDFVGEAPKCATCSSSAPLSKAHLLSIDHFNALQKRCALVPENVAQEAMEGYNKQLETESSPWVQKLELHGRDYYFNHITAKELWPQRTW